MKKTLSLFLAAAMALSMAGCSGQTGNETTAAVYGSQRDSF